MEEQKKVVKPRRKAWIMAAAIAAVIIVWLLIRGTG
jgi:hypothetical protein